MNTSGYIAILAAIFFMAVAIVVRRAGYRRYIMLASLLSVGYVTGYRWVESGHPPMLGTFEETILAALTLITASLLVDRRKSVFATYMLGMGIFVLLYGLFFDTQIRPLVISEQSLLVYFHVLFAWIGYGLYTLCFLSALYVLFSAAGRKEAMVRWALERGLLYGITAQSISFFIGSYYSSRLHGSWWVWDTVEYLFLISWFLYAVALHGRILLGWGEKKVAGWIVAAFVVTIVLYWGLVYIPWTTYHVFDMEIKIHVPLGNP